MQINADSITGKDGFFTKRYCNKIMKDGLLHFVGSDCHNSAKRSVTGLERHIVWF
ncbi:hypothetical protein M5E86_14275 [Blautia wexlerae]|nr:hypothetical protein M5E86_14275 [Blautia wexlerae]